MSIKLIGIPAAPGVAVEKLIVYRHNSTGALTLSKHIDMPFDSISGIELFYCAREQTKKEFEKLVQQTTKKLGKEEAGIFEGYIEILMDDEITDAVKVLLDNGMDTVSAIKKALENIATEFDAMEGSYMQERAVDIRDIGKRLANAAIGCKEQTLPVLTEPCILVADDLSPAETVCLELSNLRAIATDGGGPASHVAVLAKSLGIPCITGLRNISSQGIDYTANNVDCIAIVDGESATVIFDATDDEIKQYKIKRDSLLEINKTLQEKVNLPVVTNDGVHREVRANIGQIGDATLAYKAGADGVGLFRTEFLFMDAKTLPTEEEQYTAYKEVLSNLNGKPLTIRTLDIGGDKDLPALGLVKEENPFLGYRAIRFSLGNLKVFEAQLSAVLRAAAHGEIELMIPLVISLEEVRQFKQVLNECRNKLHKSNIPVGDIRVGIMVETPAAALNAFALAREVDFFSIGTNDLTQYTLAVDRGNSNVAYLYDSFQPAVLKLIDNICRAAQSAKITIAMCGEFASDERAIPLLLGLGVQEFSVAPARVALVKEIIRKSNLKDCKLLAEKVLDCISATEIQKLLKLT